MYAERFNFPHLPREGQQSVLRHLDFLFKVHLRYVSKIFFKWPACAFYFRGRLTRITLEISLNRRYIRAGTFIHFKRRIINGNWVDQVSFVLMHDEDDQVRGDFFLWAPHRCWDRYGWTECRKGCKYGDDCSFCTHFQLCPCCGSLATHRSYPQMKIEDVDSARQRRLLQKFNDILPCAPVRLPPYTVYGSPMKWPLTQQDLLPSLRRDYFFISKQLNDYTERAHGRLLEQLAPIYHFGPSKVWYRLDLLDDDSSSAVHRHLMEVLKEMVGCEYLAIGQVGDDPKRWPDALKTVRNLITECIVSHPPIDERRRIALFYVEMESKSVLDHRPKHQLQKMLVELCEELKARPAESRDCQIFCIEGRKIDLVWTNKIILGVYVFLVQNWGSNAGHAVAAYRQLIANFHKGDYWDPMSDPQVKNRPLNWRDRLGVVEAGSWWLGLETLCFLVFNYGSQMATLLAKLQETAGRRVFLPFIVRFLNGIVGQSEEALTLQIPSLRFERTFGNKVQNNNESDPVTLRIHRLFFFCWLMMLDPKLGLGEAFMYGCWEADPGTTQLLKLLIRAKQQTARLRGPRKPKSTSSKILASLSEVLLSVLQRGWALFNYCQHQIRSNTLLQSAKNIRAHYDLGNDMFELFLDPSMTYSCGVFEKAGIPIEEYDVGLLEESQRRKIDKLVDRLELSEDDHVLEIGCGWGAFAIQAVKRHGCRWTGLTISHEQLAMAKQRVEEAGLSHLIDLKYLDYRLETGTYSRLVSIEMIEAVGEQYMAEYFQVLHDRLAPGGKAVLQAITCPDAYYERYCRSSDFIRKHIFPGGHLPSLSHIDRCLGGRLSMDGDISEIGEHYATTLDLWLCAWRDRRAEILALGYSRTFHRKWEFYFALCSALFAHRHISTVQFSLRRA
ncbi:unnamed protein product, partial [Mesorhabditis spiculigera]